MILVSIIVPIYNKEKYLEECIKSICGQTYSKLEIILIDDGSVDGSASIVDSWVEKDKRIKAIHQKNSGEGAARNSGIRAASGEYLLFIDADDKAEKDLVENAVDVIIRNKADCVVYENFICDSRGGKRVACHCVDNESEWYAGTTDFIRQYFGMNARYLGTAVWNKLFRRDIVVENNLFFTDLKIGADAIFCLEYARVSKKWVRCNKVLYNYIQHEDSVMHNFDEDFEKKIECLMDSYVDYCKRYGVYNELASAVGSGNIRDIFIVCKYIDNKCHSMQKTIREYRRIMHNEKYMVRYAHVDKKIMTRNYKLVYFLLKIKSGIGMYILVQIYHKIYNL